jgi:hypothetical protein
MTVLLARAKKWAKWLAALAVLVGVAAVALFRKRKQSVLHPDHIDLALQEYERSTNEADARYVVEVAIARTTSRAERAQLLDILKEPDEVVQVQRLIEAAKRLRGDP